MIFTHCAAATTCNANCMNEQVDRCSCMLIRVGKTFLYTHTGAAGTLRMASIEVRLIFHFCIIFRPQCLSFKLWRCIPGNTERYLTLITTFSRARPRWVHHRPIKEPSVIVGLTQQARPHTKRQESYVISCIPTNIVLDFIVALNQVPRWIFFFFTS